MATVCELCHQPIRSAAARARRIGSRCWRKLRPDQRAAIRAEPFRIRAILARPAPATDGQLPLDDQEPTNA
ncbi:hypothetical protein [Streptomyces sp. NBC_00582]|uniref:hypothetical protein n=1 Tax=Streptomyces sp. NBC_00582 TaxID=2975783 RepID=UPI002E7FC4F9|nr:hypothetical protein [Streptomyces sp. NBC_00582]WUB64462.1 hypothetical protein OG852_30740 [Streptomyces sp. NBC_00582]